jgi:uncharacterized membrane protein YkoI
LIEQANQRLAAMNQQQAAIQAAQAAQTARAAAPRPAAPARAAAAPAPQFTVTAEQATNVAVQAANGLTMIRQAELVRFEGKVAYEVGFTRGAIYIDANTGTVLFNGTQGQGGGGQPASTQPPVGGSEHEGEHESEHEG